MHTGIQGRRVLVRDGTRRVIQAPSTGDGIEGENADIKTPETLCTLGIEDAHVALPCHLRDSHALIFLGLPPPCGGMRFS